MNHKEQEERIWVLLAKRHSGEASMAELSELQALLDTAVISADRLEKLDAIWNRPLENTNVDADPRLWQQLQGRIGQKKHQLKLGVWWAAAAIIVVAVGLWWRIDGVDSGTIASDNQAKTKTVLPDGTEIWLHHDSKLSYRPETFGKQDREVTLTGEAFFDVVKNEHLPFIVNAGSVVVEVKGTAFNVKAYPGKAAVETVLVRGSVTIYERQRPEKKITLQPNEKITVPQRQADGWDYEVNRVEKGDGQPLNETIWLSNTLSFDNESFEALAPKLESWYNIVVDFESDDVKHLRFSAVIKNETLEETLNAMQLSFPFHYQLTNDTLRIGRD